MINLGKEMINLVNQNYGDLDSQTILLQNKATGRFAMPEAYSPCDSNESLIHVMHI